MNITLTCEISANAKSDAKGNSESPVWNSPYDGDCDQDEMDRTRADCEVRLVWLKNVHKISILGIA